MSWSLSPLAIQSSRLYRSLCVSLASVILIGAVAPAFAASAAVTHIKVKPFKAMAVPGIWDLAKAGKGKRKAMLAGHLTPPGSVSYTVDGSNHIVLNWSGSLQTGEGWYIWALSSGAWSTFALTGSNTYNTGIPVTTPSVFSVTRYNPSIGWSDGVTVAAPSDSLLPKEEPGFFCPCTDPNQICGGEPQSPTPKPEGKVSDPVDLSTGVESYTPDGDLTAYNPNGPAASFGRRFQNDLSLLNMASPGFPSGWKHTYDVRVYPKLNNGAWGDLVVMFQNGSTVTVTPTLSGGTPTGAFTTPSGMPFLVTGTPSSTVGQWNLVTLKWTDRSTWNFSTALPGYLGLTSQLNRMGRGVSLVYDSTGRITTVNDFTSGTALESIAYDSLNNIYSVSDNNGRSVYYAVTDSAGGNGYKLTAVSQIVATGTASPPMKASYSYTAYNGANNNAPYLNTVTVPSPTGTGTSTITLSYDSTGRLSQVTDANSNSVKYTYNVSDTLVQYLDSSSAVALQYHIKFDSSQRNTGFTDAAGHSTTIQYLDSSNPRRATDFYDRSSRHTSMTYDGFGNVTSVTTPRSVTTTYTYDYATFSLGRLLSVQEGTKGATTLTYYEPSGLVATVTTPRPTGGTGTVTTTFNYDATFGEISSTVEPGNNAIASKTTTYEYQTDGTYTQPHRYGQPIKITDQLGHAQHIRYDSFGRTTSYTDASAKQWGFAYNIADQSYQVINPATGTTGTGNSFTQNDYLYPGGPLSQTTAYDEALPTPNAVRQVVYGYGLERETLSVTGSTEESRYVYDAAYRVKTLKDGNLSATQYAYNSIGQVSSITYPGGDSVTFPSYDNDGQLLQRVDGLSKITNYVHNIDPEGLLTAIQYPANTSLNVSLTYDGYGRLASWTNNVGSETYTFDDLDLLSTKVTTYTGVAAKTFSYTYFPDGSRWTMVNPAGTWTYGYDSAGRNTSLVSPAGTSSISYNNNGWQAGRVLPNGITETISYKNNGAYSAFSNKTSGGTTLNSFTSPTYDGVFNLKSFTSSVPGYTNFSGTTNFGYDTKDRLTSEASTGRTPSYSNSFGYDNAGNPTTFKGATRTFNTNNQSTTTGYTYNANGNPTTYGGITLAYDPENRMTSFGSAMSATYRADNLRASKTNSSGTTLFYYDIDGEPVVETGSTGTVTAINVYASDGLVGRQSGGTWTYYGFDQQGNVALRSDSTGAVTSYGYYDAYGVEWNSVAPPASDPFGYNAQWGYRFDRETGLYYGQNRYYDAATGGWLTRDPISFRGGINLYSYASASPIGAADVTGTQKPSKSQRNAILKAIGRIRDNGFVSEAIGLEQMLRGGQIYIDSSLSPGVRGQTTGWNPPVIGLNPNLFDQISPNASPSLTYMLRCEQSAKLEGVLVHELYHARNQVVITPVFILLNWLVGGLEPPAWRAHLKYLQAASSQHTGAWKEAYEYESIWPAGELEGSD